MEFSKTFHIHYWPAATCIWFTLTLITTYLMTMINDHVCTYLPFISSTGTMPPESCVFSLMFNMGAIFLGITMYIRYRQVDFAINSNVVVLNKRWNNVAFWSGNIICLGTTFVANFQYTGVPSVHLLGAFLLFGVAGFYLILQTRISFAFRQLYNNHPEFGIGQKILFLRAFLTLCFIVLQLITLVSFNIILSQFADVDLMCWPEERDGYQIHVVTAISEWLLFVVLLAYTLTAVNEFKVMKFDGINFRCEYVTFLLDGLTNTMVLLFT